MSTSSVRTIEYFYATSPGGAVEASELLAAFAASKVNLVAFGTVPIGPSTTQLVLFPDDPDRLVEVAESIGIALHGPEHAVLVNGADRLGVLADVHRRLAEAGVSVYASNGIVVGESYGCVLYVRHEQVERARSALAGL